MKRLVLTIFIISSLLTGCATLKVDVDIYKGPLSNTAEVQTEQMYAMAIAAQPMLERLSTHESLKPAQRETVTAILSLYKDQAPPELSGFLHSIKNYKKSYEDGLARFNELSLPDWWQAIKPKSMTKANELLIQGYDNFFSDATDWSWKWQLVAGTSPVNSDVIEKNLEEQAKQKEVVTNNIFWELLNTDLANVHAKQLFPDDAEKQNIFAQRVKAKAQAFWDTRQALRGLLMTALSALREKSVDGSGLLFDKYPKARAATANLATSLIHFGYMKTQVNKEISGYSYLSGLDLKSKWDEYLPKLAFALTESKRESDILINELMVVDEKLLKLAESERKFSFGLTIGPDFSSENDSSQKPQELIADITSEIVTITSTAGPLQNGREKDGINSLVNEYLRLRKAAVAQPDLADRANRVETQLISTLVAFAEKVLFLANNEYFLEKIDDGTLSSNNIKHYVQVLEAIGNSIITLADDYSQRRAYTQSLKGKWAIEQSALLQVYTKDAVTVLRAMIKDLEIERNGGLTENFFKITSTLKAHSVTGVEKELAAFDNAVAAVKSIKTASSIAGVETTASALTDTIKNVPEPDATAMTTAMNTWRTDNGEVFKLNTVISELNAYADWARQKGAVAVDTMVFIDELIKKLTSNKTDGDKDPKVIAAAELAKRKYSVSSIAVGKGAPDGNTNKDPRQVIDQLAAQLRYQLVAEIQANGASSEVATNLTASLKQLATYRSQMAFLRTSGTYLRNSYPTSTLQSDPEIGWTNLLGRHAFQTMMPFYSAFDQLVPANEDAKMRREIDKQFWQNINSVQVSGAGDTNYVIAKDDIGNWYVKAYATDPDKIIKSVKGLAMYSFAPALKAVLPANTSKDKATAVATTAVDETLTPVPDPQQTVLEKLLKTHEAKDIERLATIRAELSGEMENDGKKLLDAIKKAWSDNGALKTVRSQLDEALQAAANKTLVPAYDQLGSEQITAGNLAAQRIKVLSAMGALRRFGVTLIQEIRTRERNTDDDISAESSVAQKLAVTIVRSRLDKYITARQTEVEGYKITLTTLAESL